MISRVSETVKGSAPGIWDRLLFFLLFSGPPKLRLRDPSASLDAVVDWVVILHLTIWVIAGLWIVNKLWFSKPPVAFNPSVLEKLSLVLVCCLSVSMLFSEGPGLTAFKIYQLLVTMVFVSVFRRIYGVQACLEGILFGSALLCACDIVAALVAPEMVFGQSEFGSLRFRGDLIAQTGVVGALALTLLLSSQRKRRPFVLMGGIAVASSVLLFSLMRTAYVAFIAFLLLALWKVPNIQLLRRVARWGVLVLSLAMVGGVMAHLEEYRPAESIWTLSDRLGLWAYLIDTMWTKSPWFGLGYFSASRIYGPEYNVDLGTAHSVFVEVLAGGGIISFAALIALFFLLNAYGFRLLFPVPSPICFMAVGLLLVTQFFLFVGSELEAEPAGFAFWTLVAIIPVLGRGTSSKRDFVTSASQDLQPSGAA